MAKKTIMYGVGTTTCIDLDDKNKIIAFGKLQNLTVNFSSDSEEIHGGDDPYPITEFPKTRSITVTAQDAMFDVDLFEFSQGAKTEAIEKAQILEQIDFVVPENGVLELKHKPDDGTVVISGLTNSADIEPAEPTEEGGEAPEVDTTKQFTVTENKITLDKSLAGTDVMGYYYRTTENKATKTSGFKSKFPRPFKFVHRIPVYNTNNQIVQQAQLTIYKAKSDNSLELSHAPQTAYAPQLSIKALDPKRPDGILWDYVIEEVPAEDATDDNMRV